MSPRASAGAATRALTLAALALVAFAGACKLLLFWNLEYRHSDLYSAIDMSRSWLLRGRLLYDNAYGSEAAIHNFYLLLAFSPLTAWMGAYGLFAGLTALEALAVARVARTSALDFPGRVALLAGLVSPLAFYVFDDGVWGGFHPELCYPPLATLFVLGLVERRAFTAALAACATVLVKEDGALVCGGVLVAFFARQLWDARAGPAPERRLLLRRTVLSAALSALVFLAGLALLWWVGRASPEGQTTAAERAGRALATLARTLAGDAVPGRRSALLLQLASHATLTALLLAPLASAARLARAAALVLATGGPLLAVVIVSDAHYKFMDLLWAPRAATLLAFVLGCGAVAATGPAPAPRRARLAAFALASWVLQVLFLGSLGYRIGHRLDLPALWAGRGYARANLPEAELRAWGCVARRLPSGLPVASIPELFPIFHRQSIVFEGLEAKAPEPARLRVFRVAPGGADARRCIAAAGLPYCVEATPEVEATIAGCTRR